MLKEPLGLVTCIVPWNYPLLLLAWKLAPVLAAGNAALCKPSELTPLSTLALAPCVEHLPAGLVALLAGGGDVGERLVDDERVDGIAFTGSVATGTRIAERAARRIARVNLELGGKDPFIVCADVAGEIEIAARGGAWAAFLNAGQVCTSAERFYVQREVYDDFLSAFVDHTRTLKVGDPMDPATDVGPMVSAAQRDKVRAQVEAAVAAGAEVLTGGDGAGHERGYYFAPTVVTGAPLETDLLREETFGPVAPIVPVASLDEAIELANGVALRPRRQRLHARPGDRDPLRARAARRHGLDQRPADRQRRRPVRRHEALRARPRARPGGPRRLPGDQARPHRDQARGQGLVVPIRVITSGGVRDVVGACTRPCIPARSATSC